MTPEIVRRLVHLAYELGWQNACNDHLIQNGTRTVAANPDHPIGQSKYVTIDGILHEIDPNDILGLRP